MHLRPSRRFAAPLAFAALLTGLGIAVPTAAHADRCEPEEIILGPDTSPIDERDNPACTAIFFYVYPFICTDDPNQPPPTLIGANGCTSNIRLRPSYVPPVIPPYNPNVGRAACNIILYANPNGTCVISSDPASGSTHLATHLGDITIPGQPRAVQEAAL